MLAHFPAGRFAPKHSPSREGREVFFASPEKERLAGEAQRTGDAAIDDIKSETRERVQDDIPEMIEGMEETEANARELLTIALESPELEQATIDAAKACGPQLKGVPEGSAEYRQIVLREMLRAPENTLRFADQLERRRKRHEELLLIVHRRITGSKRFLQLAGVSEKTADSLPAERLVMLFARHTDATSPADIEREFQLQTAIPDPQERESTMRFLSIGLKDAQKEQNMGLRDRDNAPTGEADTDQEQGRFRKEYWEKLRRMEERLKLHLLRQIRHRGEPLLARMSALENDAKTTKDPRKVREIGALWDHCQTPFLDMYDEWENEKDRSLEEQNAADRKLLEKENYISSAGLWLEQLPRVEQTIAKSEKRFATGVFVPPPDQTIEEPERLAWVKDVIRRASNLLTKHQWDEATEDKLHQLIDEKYLGQDFFRMSSSQQRIGQYLSILEAGGPAVALQMVEGGRENDGLEKETVDLPAWCAEARERLTKLTPRLEKIARHPSLATLRVEQRIKRLLDAIRAGVEMVEQVIATPKAAVIRAEQELLLGKLENCADDAESMPSRVHIEKNPAEYLEICGGAKKSVACYLSREKMIYINGSKLPTTKPARTARLNHLREHEEGHALVHILQDTAFPDLLFNQYDWLWDEATLPEDQEVFVEKLLEAGEAGWERKRADYEKILSDCETTCDDPQSAQQAALRSYLDELEQHFVRWQNGEEKPRNPAEEWLHKEVCRRRDLEPYVPTVEYVHTAVHMSDADIDPGPQEEVDTAYNAGDDLARVSKMILIIEAFGETNPAYQGEIRACLDGTGGREGIRTLYRRYLRIWKTGKLPDGTRVKPENEQFNEAVLDLTTVSQSIHDDFEKIKNQKTDPQHARAQKIGGPFSNLTFISISDVVKIWKDISEDFVSQWTRAQELRTSEVEEWITSGIPGNLPFPWGKYAGRLKHYAKRRKQQAEQDEVHKWEEAFKIIDPHKLLEMLGRSPTRDQLKAIILVLTHKGHMDWSDQHLWEALALHSHYRMPREAIYDDVLRDMWLRKICTDIWPEEKEFFDHAKTENENAFESGKNRYTGEADDYDNIKNGMSGQLERMLQMWVDSDGNPPEEVSPHRYEEFIHYAMRNGKMSMEQKLYYLVRGAAEGLLPLDRVRSLAGEKGKILNKFPFIEYFSGQNNTLAEIMALNDRLINYEKGHDSFKPDYKTTLWARLEVSRNPKVLNRIGKGTSKAGAEDIDHEDWPWFLPMQGYSGVRNALNVISGSRQKISPQARMNTYFGFSSIFKVFGHVVNAESEGVARLTEGDAKNLAQTIAAYIDYDNILMQNASDGQPRPYLTESELEMRPPSSDGRTTRQCRAEINEFIRALLDRYGDDIKNDAEWQRVTGGMDMTMFAPTDNNTRRQLSDDQKKDIFKGTDTFARVLERVVVQKTQGLRESLLSNVDELSDESGSMEAGGRITKERTVQYFRELHHADLEKEPRFTRVHAHH